MYLNRIHTATFLPFIAYNTDNQLIIDNITKTLGGDELGEVIINFADPVVISDEFRYHYKPRTNPREQAVVDYTEPTFNSKYYTGWYRLYISPKKTNL